MDARIRLTAQVIIGLQQDLKKSRQVFFAELRRSLCERRPLIRSRRNQIRICAADSRDQQVPHVPDRDRKSTRLNSSHGYISDAVFCLKKKKEEERVGDLVVRTNEQTNG